MIDEDLEIWNKYILHESPLLIGGMNKEEIGRFENADVNKIIQNTDYIGDFKDFKIYFHQNENDYYFIKDSKLVAFYKFNKLPENRIQTRFIWNKREYSGAFFDIFVGFILPKYKNVVSDYRMSEMGFNFWEKTLTKTDFKIFLFWDNKKMKQLNNVDDLFEYKEKTNRENKYFNFLIEYE